jgi:hypothetical protein
MLPFQPEPIWQLQSRYKDALLPIYGTRGMLLHPPSLQRAHVFDSEDGLRLIVFVAGMAQGTDLCRILQLSGNALPNTYVDVQWATISLDDVLSQILRRFAEVSKDTAEGLVFLGFTPEQRVPHWMRIEKK